MNQVISSEDLKFLTSSISHKAVAVQEAPKRRFRIKAKNLDTGECVYLNDGESLGQQLLARWPEFKRVMTTIEFCP